MGRVVTADGNFEDIHLEKDAAVAGAQGAWMGVAKRVADRNEVEHEKPLPEVKEQGHGRHGSFDFERGEMVRGGLAEPRKGNGGGGGGGGWRLSWWGRSEAAV